MKVSYLIAISLITIFYFFIILLPASSITTKQISQNYKEYINKEIKIINVAVIDCSSEKLENGELFFTMKITNTHNTYSTPKNKEIKDLIKVYIRTENNSSFASDMSYYKRNWFPELSLKISDKIITLRELPRSVDSVSWLTTPYELSIRLFSPILPLKASLIIAFIIQAIISSILAVLAIEGVIWIFPSPA